MKRIFTLSISCMISALSCFTQTFPNDSTVVNDSIYPSDCPIIFDVLVMESFPPQYRFLPSRPDTFATFFWDFGDGNWSYEIKPSHTYQYSGTYMVCLKYISPDGCTSFICDTLDAQGSDNECQAFFQAYRLSVNWQDSVNIDSLNLKNPPYLFIDQSKGNVIGWKWVFGDGSVSDEQQPVHWFANPGVYNVCLEITTGDNCTSLYCSELFVDTPSYCRYRGTVKDYTGLDGCGLMIVLDNGTVLEPVEMVPGFELYAGQRVMLGYTELPDVASICMAGTIARIDCIQEIPDSCSVSFYFYSLPWVSSVPPIYKFEIDSALRISEAFWDFGDGTVTNDYSPTHRFQFDGNYTVCLKIATYEGCTASYCQTAWFDGYDPLPGLCDNFIRLTTDIVLNGQTCNGTATAGLVNNSGYPVPASEFLWSTGETTPEIFNLCPGFIYNVTVIDATGCAVSGSFSFGTPLIFPDSLIGYWNYEQDDMDFVFNLPVYSDSVYCEWDFGDGQTAVGSLVNHTYSSFEDRTVQMKVFDLSGNLLYNGQILVSPGSPTGFLETLSDSPNVYPVPSKEWLYVELPGPERISIIEIMNAGGRIQNVISAIDQSGHMAEINISGITAGFYIGRIIIESGDVTTFKFVKQ